MLDHFHSETPTGTAGASRMSRWSSLESAERCMAERKMLPNRGRLAISMVGMHGIGGAMIYRRRLKSDTWHFCSNCSNWPKKGYQAKTQLPTTGELCDQCKGKRKKDKCKP